MVIFGIDYSITSPACVKAVCDDEFNFTSLDYVGFTDIKKVLMSDRKLLFNKKKDFTFDIQRYIYLSEHIKNFIYSGDEIPMYGAIEGYAMGANGKIFDIAEATGVMKYIIYNNGTNLRIYPPTTVKKFTVGNGLAGKVSMFEEFVKVDEPLLDLSHLEDLSNPKEDLVDAYFIVKFLQTELKLRYGFLQLKDLTLKQIEVFNEVSKSNPINLLSRSFIHN